MTTDYTYIATNPDQTAIFGIGPTPEDAAYDADTCGGSESPKGYQWKTRQATDRLTQAVAECGGEITWIIRPDGVADLP